MMEALKTPTLSHLREYSDYQYLHKSYICRTIWRRMVMSIQDPGPLTSEEDICHALCYVDTCPMGLLCRRGKRWLGWGFFRVLLYSYHSSSKNLILCSSFLSFQYTCCNLLFHRISYWIILGMKLLNLLAVHQPSFSPSHVHRKSRCLNFKPY